MTNANSLLRYLNRPFHADFPPALRPQRLIAAHTLIRLNIDMSLALIILFLAALATLVAGKLIYPTLFAPNHAPISAFALGIIKSMTDHPDQWNYYGTYINHHTEDDEVDLSLSCGLFGQWRVNHHSYVTKREIAVIKAQGIWALRRHEAREIAAARAAHRAPFEALGCPSDS